MLFENVVLIPSDGSAPVALTLEPGRDPFDFARELVQAAVASVEVLDPPPAEDEEPEEKDEMHLPTVVYVSSRQEALVSHGFGEGSIVVCKGDPRIENVLWTSDPYSVFI